MTNGFSDARNNFPGREPTGKWQVSDYCLTNCQAPSKLAIRGSAYITSRSRASPT